MLEKRNGDKSKNTVTWADIIPDQTYKTGNWKITVEYERPMNTPDVIEQSQAANAGCLQRVVRWPLFWLLWSIVFGTFAGTCWATGIGTPTLQAFCAGLHIGFAFYWLNKTIKAI